MRRFVIPASIFVLGLLSTVTLSSIVPGLASKQLVFFILGLALFFSLSRLPFSRALSMSGFAYIGLCALLVLTLLIGKDTRNTARWINVGGIFVIQGSQLAIPIVGLVLSNWFSRDKTASVAEPKAVTITQLIGGLGLIALPAILILISPDLGTTIAYVCSVSGAILFSRTRLLHLALLAALAGLAALLIWNFVLHDYQKQRIHSFVDAQDVQGASYNAQQAVIAVGSGRLFGRGLGQGIQSHLRFLPERQTDFIFASFSEEFGFIGVLVVLSLYVLLVVAILRVALAATDQAAQLFCLIVALMIIVQAGINVGMNIGLLPITGITLPLLSYGGSSILSICGTLGIVQSIARQQRTRPQRHIS